MHKEVMLPTHMNKSIRKHCLTYEFPYAFIYSCGSSFVLKISNTPATFESLFKIASRSKRYLRKFEPVEDSSTATRTVSFPATMSSLTRGISYFIKVNYTNWWFVRVRSVPVQRFRWWTSTRVPLQLDFIRWQLSSL